jgi:hypothetical protein
MQIERSEQRQRMRRLKLMSRVILPLDELLLNCSVVWMTEKRKFKKPEVTCVVMRTVNAWGRRQASSERKQRKEIVL